MLDNGVSKSGLEGEELEQKIQAVRQKIQAVEQKTQAVAQETQALEIILNWIKLGGKEALRLAEYALDEREDKHTNIEEHTGIVQLMKLMEQEYYWRTQSQMTCIQDRDKTMSVSAREEIFRTMRREILELIGNYRRFGLWNSTLEIRFSTTLDRILRLSSWTPSCSHNEHLRTLLRDALLLLNDLGGNEEYQEDLRDFMKRHTAFCAFTLDNAYSITAEDSETTAELCKNLRRLAQKLGKIASTKADQYQKLYENFIAHKEDLSHWLDSASPGQGNFNILFLFFASPFTYSSFFVGRSLVDSFTDSLKDMASSMRREANFWNSQSNQFHKWPNIRQSYSYAIDAMPLDQLNDYRSSTTSTPSIHGLVTQVRSLS